MGKKKGEKDRQKGRKNIYSRIQVRQLRSLTVLGVRICTKFLFSRFAQYSPPVSEGRVCIKASTFGVKLSLVKNTFDIGCKEPELWRVTAGEVTAVTLATSLRASYIV